MLKLRIGNSQLSGVVDLIPSGTIDGYTSYSAVTLEASRQPSYDEWYDRTIRKKQAAMTLGGTSTEGLYAFETGLSGVYKDNYLKSIQNITPEDGEFWILPGKTVDVSETDDKLTISLPVHHKQPDKNYAELDLMLWRLYHCVNSLTGRLQIFDPSIPRDGDPAISNTGPYLGTYLQYQALIARWNTFAWDSSFMLEVTPAGERATIVLGYTNLNCVENGPITMSFTATRSSTTSNTSSAEYSASPLTIYNQGVDSNLDEDNVVITTEYYRNGKVTSGSGYELGDPGALDSVGVAVALDRPENSMEPIMTAEQYYRSIAAIAPSVGVDFEYTVQEGSPSVFHTIDIVAEWNIGGTKLFSKQATVKIAAVGRLQQIE